MSDLPRMTYSRIMNNRIHSFDGIENFRDFGGYLSALGGRAAAGRLFRSGHYARATAADLATLRGLGIRVITDLRRPTERAAERVPRLEEFSGQIIENDIGDHPEGPHIAFLRETDMSAGSVARFLQHYYSSAPFEDRYSELFGRWLRALSDLNGAGWIHCAAGKDRTGILVALTHDLLGVAEEQIIADFLLTNQVMDVERRLFDYGPKLEKLCGRAPSDAAIRCFLGFDRDSIDATLRAVRDRHGSTEQYVVQHLGVSPERVNQIRQRLLA